MKADITHLYSPEAERAVLGSMMAQPAEVIDEVMASLSKNDFFVPANQEVFTALTSMHGIEAIDVMTVHQWLLNRKLAESVGSPGILAELLVGFATHLNVSSYIRIVKDKSLLRSLQGACSAIVKDIAEMPDSVPSILDRAEKAIFSITHGQQTEAIWSAEACVAEYRAERERIQRGEQVNRLATGIRALDQANGGLPVPGLTIIGAGTGAGKSVIMQNIAENCCRSGMKVGIFSLEMNRKQLLKRWVASTASIDGRRLNEKLHDAEVLRVETALTGINRWRFDIDQTSRLTLPTLRSRARIMVRNGAELLEIDYLQLMRGMNSRMDRREQLAEASGEIKILSMELNIPIIILSQVNREGRKAGDLQLYNLAECSALEQDADAVILLEKKEGAENCTNRAIPYIARIAKYREGAIGDEEITLNAPESRFS